MSLSESSRVLPSPPDPSGCLPSLVWLFGVSSSFDSSEPSESISLYLQFSSLDKVSLVTLKILSHYQALRFVSIEKGFRQQCATDLFSRITSDTHFTGWGNLVYFDMQQTYIKTCLYKYCILLLLSNHSFRFLLDKSALKPLHNWPVLKVSLLLTFRTNHENRRLNKISYCSYHWNFHFGLLLFSCHVSCEFCQITDTSYKQSPVWGLSKTSKPHFSITAHLSTLFLDCHIDTLIFLFTST